MIKIILDLLPYLFIAISANIMTGLYFNLETMSYKFDLKKLLIGIGKAFIISYSFIATAVVYDKIFGLVSVGDIELAPDLLIKSAIVMYVGKALLNLKDILQVEKMIKEIEQEIDDELEEEITEIKY